MTKMLRKDLLAALETCGPALALHNLVPVMTHFCFTGKSVMAYDDKIAISYPLKTEFVGAVPGKTLLDLIKASKFKECELVPGKKDLIIKGGAKTTFKLPVLTQDSFAFEMPKIDTETGDLGKVLKEFIRCLKGVFRSLGSDTSIPEQLGVTVRPNGSTLELYTTNADTISGGFVDVGKSVPTKKSVILSTPFCKQMLALTKNVEKAYLAITPDYSLLKAGNVMLFGKLIKCDRPYEFDDVISEHLNASTKKQLVEIPKGFSAAIDRAIIITETTHDKSSSDLTVGEGYLRMASKSDRGEVKDKFRLAPDHKDISVRIDPKRVKEGVSDFAQMVLTPKAAVMTNKVGDIYLVSCIRAAG